MRTPTLALLLASLASSLWSATPESAALAVNALGLDLHRQMPKEGNLCLSPYSIQSALAMTYLGASGVTQDEMARVLHFPADKQALSESFKALNQALEEAKKESVNIVSSAKKNGGSAEPLTLRVANRLFAQTSYEFRKPFLTKLKTYFGAPLQSMNFRKDPAGATREINRWVAKQTQNRIRDLIPSNTLTRDTSLVLANALYFKASWADEFHERATSPEPFHVDGGRQTSDVPTMTKTDDMCYYNGRGFQAVALPYAGGSLHFLLILPDSVGDLPRIEGKLTPQLLLACAKAKPRLVSPHLPKFKMAPPTTELGDMLKKLGMTTAFDQPHGSADFDAMPPSRPKNYLYISNILHKTFLALDEKGTEAAAATAVIMGKAPWHLSQAPSPSHSKPTAPSSSPSSMQKAAPAFSSGA